MRTQHLALWVITLAFGAYSGYVLLHYGYLGLFQAAMANAATWQVLLDLVIVCALAISWMLRDAREHGRRAWPYVLLTLAAGSFGPLLYLLIERRPAPAGDKAQTTYA